jgi:hypothetical protein
VNESFFFLFLEIPLIALYIWSFILYRKWTRK